MSRSLRSFVSWLGLLLCFASRGAAQDHAATGSQDEAREEARPRRVGVVLIARGEASSEMADSLTELLIAAVAGRGPAEFVGKEEFEATLGRDEAGALACIESDACVGRMGRELGLDELIAGTLYVSADRPDHYRFELYRLDVENGNARGRVARDVDGGLGALLGALTSSVNELYVERVEPSALVVETTPRTARLALDDEALERGSDGVFRARFLAPGAHVLTAEAAGHARYERSLSLEPGTTLMFSVELSARPPESLMPLVAALCASGVVSLGVGVGLGVASQSTDPALSMRQSPPFYDTRALEATSANVLFAVGGSLLVAGLIALLVDVSGTERSTALARAPGEVATW